MNAIGIDMPSDARADADAGCPVEVAAPPGRSDVLGREECLELLARAPLGRLAVTCGALPLVLPVRFALADDRILSQVVRGSTLDAATRDVVIASEADEVDPRTMAGWSVLVVGVVTDALAADSRPTSPTPPCPGPAQTATTTSSRCRPRSSPAAAPPSAQRLRPPRDLTRPAVPPKRTDPGEAPRSGVHGAAWTALR